MKAPLTTDSKVYEPFPEGTKPDGWPTEYVSLVDYTSARHEIEKLRALLAESRRPHYECDDCWYSCATLTCDDERRGKPCDCGADEWNAKVEFALAQDK